MRPVSAVLNDFSEYDGAMSSSVCLGNFDGTHRGHQEILGRALKEAKRQNLASVVFTFSPHPLKLLKGNPPQLLFTPEEKREILGRVGFDFILEQTFDSSFMKIKAEDFIDRILVQHLKAKYVVVGESFTFGFRAAGHPDLLRKKFGENLFTVAPIKDESRDISSSWIRDLIKQGQLERASELLGYPYFVTGKVVRGHSRGSKMGFPTANLTTNKDCVPCDGIYTTVVEDLGSGKFFLSATSIGHNPTFGNSQPKSIETHLISFRDNLEGRTLRIFFLRFLRSELKFESVEELVKEMNRDIEKSAKIFHDLGLLTLAPSQNLLSLNQPSSEAQRFQPYQFIEKINSVA